MIKGVTTVRAASSAAAWQRAASLFAELGFEPGKGWDDGTGKGAAFLAPLANVEFVTGRLPAVPELLVEVTQLDLVHGIVKRWAAAEVRSEDLPQVVGEIADTHWKSRLFTAEIAGTTFGFWERNDVLAGRPIALEGDLSAAGMRFGIVVARWNAVITDRLLQGSLDAILRSGGKLADVQIVRVPGAWEIPNAARMLADARRADGTRSFDAVITLGCLLRGETAHYEAIYNEAARGIGQSQQDTGVPHAFGVLTCETLEQALNRAGVKAGNKGFEAAVAAIEMVSIAKKLGDAGHHLGSGVSAAREVNEQLQVAGDLPVVAQATTGAAAEADAIVEEAGS
ncbi:6,7-dimethyl-8-ribityllumazine synthase [Terriglobus aquaticus]|uniref:6,7-dimethyl-8-ribityllumazine synthase n=1 Tax=Terriglobus aquaticus TaxID=940139 RepID=A0ABW9KG03_9BACT|nr:6,7-dimethyl-8-ribityllumazine synthase [Terriglobus aquaticus]